MPAVDPNATLQKILEAFRDGLEGMSDLATWLGRGGFQPTLTVRELDGEEGDPSRTTTTLAIYGVTLPVPEEGQGSTLAAIADGDEDAVLYLQPAYSARWGVVYVDPGGTYWVVDDDIEAEDDED